MNCSYTLLPDFNRLLFFLRLFGPLPVVRFIGSLEALFKLLYHGVFEAFEMLNQAFFFFSSFLIDAVRRDPHFGFN